MNELSTCDCEKSLRTGSCDCSKIQSGRLPLSSVETDYYTFKVFFFHLDSGRCRFESFSREVTSELQAMHVRTWRA